jgi:hypothetical protein
MSSRSTTVALGHDQLVPAVGDGVGDERARDAHPVEPAAARVAALGDVELIHVADERVVAGQRALEERIQVLPSLESAMLSKPLEEARFGVRRAAEQERVVRAEHPRQRHRGVEHPALASTCTMNGPNFSPNQNMPSGAWRTDSMSKSPPVRTRSGVFSLTIGKGSRSTRSSSSAGLCTGAG